MKNTHTAQKRSLLLAGEFAAFGAGTVILLVFIASTLDASLIQQGQGAAVITSVLADLANTDRGLNHVGNLSVSPELTRIAQEKANDMAQKGYFAHNAPDGKTPWYWYQKEGYSFSYAGENLAIDFSDSAEVERAWMQSPTHRANLLNTHFTEVGIATAVGTYQGHTTTFVVEEFGTPSRTSTPAPVASVVPADASQIATAETKVTPTVAGAHVAAPPAAVHTQKVATSASTTATSTPTLPAAALASAPPEDTVTGPGSLWDIFAASPKTTLRYAYYLFGLIILAALVWETGLEIRQGHRKHVALAIGLITLMGTLFLGADRFVFTDPILAEAGASIPGAL
jgi:uncharacterized protein YkwD